MNEKSSSINLRIKDLRKDKLLTQEDLADLLGISRQSVIAIENGRYLPSLSLAVQLAEVFSLNLGELIDEQNEKISQVASQALSECISWPRVNIKKVENVLILQANLAGYNERDVEVEVANYQVHLRGQIKPDKDLSTYYLQEITSANFDRTVNLPKVVVPDRSTANFDNGLLTVTMPILQHQTKKLKVN